MSVWGWCVECSLEKTCMVDCQHQTCLSVWFWFWFGRVLVMLLSRPLRSLAVCGLVLLPGVSLQPCVGLGEAPCSLLSPPFSSPLLLSLFPCSSSFFFSLNLILSLSLSFSPPNSPFTLWWKAGFFFFSLNGTQFIFSTLLCPGCPTLPRNLSAATGNSVHTHMCVLSILCWCQIRNVCQSKALPSSLKVDLRWQESPVATWAPHSDLHSSL